MNSLWITLLLTALLGVVLAYDGYSACPKQYRSVRLRSQLPCDFQQQSWCTVPGSAYPWHAVRRFVHENHGLMRRMYGDERHISVLRAEIESNDVELIRDPSWHLEDDVKRRYSAKPHFRPANRNNQPHAPPPPPPPPEPPAPASTTASTTTASSTTASTVSSSTTTSTTTTSTSTTTVEPEVVESQEPLGLYNGRIHPHLINASLLSSTTASPTASTSTTSASTSSSAAPTTVDDWATEETTQETTVTTLPTTSAHASPGSSPGPSTTTSTSTTASTTTSTAAAHTENDELSDVEDNVADEADGDASSAQETLFQDADPQASAGPGLGPGPDAAQQPGKPATPLIKLRGVNACPVKEEVVAPFWANNTRGEVLALLNLYPFEQYVHWEKCTHEHKQMFCREGCRCEQQYRLHRLLAYDPNNECRGIFSDWFKFPSCCICRCYDLPAEFRFTSRSPRTPAMRADPARHTPGPPKDWYRLQASGG